MILNVDLSKVTNRKSRYKHASNACGVKHINFSQLRTSYVCLLAVVWMTHSSCLTTIYPSPPSPSPPPSQPPSPPSIPVPSLHPRPLPPQSQPSLVLSPLYQLESQTHSPGSLPQEEGLHIIRTLRVPHWEGQNTATYIHIVTSNL